MDAGDRHRLSRQRKRLPVSSDLGAGVDISIDGGDGVSFGLEELFAGSCYLNAQRPPKYAWRLHILHADGSPTLAALEHMGPEVGHGRCERVRNRF